ncbi:hypothetical protein [Dyadobacter aurulentus]|uniref:hypothetical protein n=1 Tax=Dyadobacter sp. UC 10 TaxID=2605428 RepID=UPI0011F2223F|nr:hypothetical protein [Dyadobacter sp. UC 10]KAA0990013.1 hypothetical protein FXO21_07495 [Dyadobacter sp. UC 10]
MEHFKKELFFQEHNAHISCQPISNSEMLFLNGFLEQRYGINNSINGNFFKVLLKKLSYKKEYDGVDTSLEIEAVFQDLALQNDSEVFVIWNYPGDMDKFDLSYLLKYWEDIWFSVSDEAIGIFFPVMDRIIVVTHYNVIYY